MEMHFHVKGPVLLSRKLGITCNLGRSPQQLMNRQALFTSLLLQAGRRQELSAA